MSIRLKFILHSYINKDGEQQVMLRISANGMTRIGLKIYGKSKYFIPEKGRFREVSSAYRDKNILIAQNESRANEIVIQARLQNITLDYLAFKKAFEEKIYTTNFIDFIRASLEREREEITEGTYHRYKSIIRKLSKMYNDSIPFDNINEMWIDDFRSKLVKLGNADTTIAANLNAVKKYLNVARKYRIRLNIDPRDIKSGSTRGAKSHLSQKQVSKLLEYYFNKFITEEVKLVLGYFLLGCYWGMRFSDLMKLKRKEVLKGEFYYVAQKTKRYESQTQKVVVSESTREIINNCEKLFDKKLSNQYVNRELKKIARTVKIKQNITFHTSRHTFATNFLNAGGTVEDLQILLVHSDISQTMEYVHINNQEIASKLNILDSYY
ncbi:MAG TPA: tyrosine-type recombinase/integrase [Flavobacteriaceae bacterium]|nr:tyrosine-type recombinase/integrase [Flavobacteriaceae bacterium]